VAHPEDTVKTSRRIIALVLLLATPSIARTQSRTELHDAMRKLWTDHVVWTRLFIISAAANLGDKDVTTKRLLQNQTDIGDAVVAFYGRDAGTKLTGLLTSHILIAADLVGAAKAGNAAAVDSLNKKWRVNADELATFLHAANPQHWPTATLRTAMYPPRPNPERGDAPAQGGLRRRCERLRRDRAAHSGHGRHAERRDRRPVSTTVQPGRQDASLAAITPGSSDEPRSA